MNGVSTGRSLSRPLSLAYPVLPARKQVGWESLPQQGAVSSTGLVCEETTILAPSGQASSGHARDELHLLISLFALLSRTPCGCRSRLWSDLSLRRDGKGVIFWPDRAYPHEGRARVHAGSLSGTPCLFGGLQITETKPNPDCPWCHTSLTRVFLKKLPFYIGKPLSCFGCQSLLSEQIFFIVGIINIPRL